MWDGQLDLKVKKSTPKLKQINLQVQKQKFFIVKKQNKKKFLHLKIWKVL